MASLTVFMITVTIVVSLIRVSGGDVFSSATHLRMLYELEEEALLLVEEKMLDDDEDTDTELDTALLSRWRAALNDPMVNLGHPVDAFHLVKRWNKLCKELPDVIEDLSELDGIGYPDDADETGAAIALLRLQQTYQLNTHELAAGQVHGYQSVEPLDADDCYSMGLVSIAAKDYGQAVQWLDLTISMAKNLKPFHFSLGDAYYNLAETHFWISDYHAALHAATKAQEEDPDNFTFTDYYKAMKNMADTLDGEESSWNGNTWQRTMSHSWREDYELLCRGGTSDMRPPSLLAPVCRYKPGLLPYVIYREEILSWDPRISMFYDVISDSEIQHVKELAIPQLTRALVGDDEISEFRVGKLSWLWDFDSAAHQDSEFVRMLSSRVGDITGLDTTYHPTMSCAEAFQVVNYGIGGHYEPHYDYRTEELLELVPAHLQGSGDRITTFMFYLGDVTLGGATVFPEIGIRVPAVKNAAAFWYNARPSGDYDSNTLHAGCPVLIGEKWVANKWITEFGQVFRRRCPQDEDAIWDV